MRTKGSRTRLLQFYFRLPWAMTQNLIHNFLRYEIEFTMTRIL